MQHIQSQSLIPMVHNTLHILFHSIELSWIHTYIHIYIKGNFSKCFSLTKSYINFTKMISQFKSMTFFIKQFDTQQQTQLYILMLLGEENTKRCCRPSCVLIKVYKITKKRKKSKRELTNKLRGEFKKLKIGQV